jgi:hypothetical protein
MPEALARGRADRLFPAGLGPRERASMYRFETVVVGPVALEQGN